MFTLACRTRVWGRLRPPEHSWFLCFFVWVCSLWLRSKVFALCSHFKGKLLLLNRASYFRAVLWKMCSIQEFVCVCAWSFYPKKSRDDMEVRWREGKCTPQTSSVCTTYVITITVPKLYMCWVLYTIMGSFHANYATHTV